MHISNMSKTAALASVIIATLFSSSTHCAYVTASHENEIGGRKVEWPCTDGSAIQWIRHPKDCSKYYICHFGQPLSMPSCPFGQVWGIKAKNCVPEHSRWNDCHSTNGPQDVKDNVKDNLIENVKSIGQKYHSVSSTPESNKVSYKPTPTKRGRQTHHQQTTTYKTALPTTTTPAFTTGATATTTARPVRKIQKFQRATPLPQNDYGKVIPPKAIRKSDKSEYDRDEEKYPTVTSPFRQNPKGRYYTYNKGKKTLVPTSQKKLKPTKPSATAPPATDLRTTPRRVYTFPVPLTTATTPRQIPGQHRKQKPAPKTTSSPRRVKPDSKPSKAPKSIYVPIKDQRRLRPIQRTRPTQKTKPTQKLRPTQDTKPTEKLRPTQKTGPTHNVRPIQKLKPTQDTKPTEKLRPTQQTRPTQKFRPTKKLTPTQRTKVTLRLRPTKKVTPTQRTKPTQKFRPTKKLTPTQRTKPTQKLRPTKKLTPTQRTKPTKKLRPTKKLTPTQRTKPTQKLRPTKKITPTQRTKPTQKLRPTQDTRPTQRTGPVQKTKHIEELKPIHQTKSIEKAKPTQKQEKMTPAPTRPLQRRTRPTLRTTTPPPPTTTTAAATTPGTEPRPTTAEAPVREVKQNEGRTFGLNTPAPSEWVVKPMQLRLPENHPCHSNPGHLVEHPKQCHWYYNCTVAALEHFGGHLSALEEECRYPQLFDTVTGRCREFINVKCQDRFEPVDPCEYQDLQCRSANCVPCHNRYGTCRGRKNGIYPFHTARWTPTFITCYQQRNIAQDDCQPPTPIFSPDALDCVALFDVPKVKGGLRPDCSFRDDGFFPDEQGRCGIFFECRDHEFAGYDECPSGTVFDPMTLRCQLLDRATPPCGEGQNPSCTDRQDGFHADPFGRCPYYFECRKNQFVRQLTCDYGSFDPVSQECVIATELIPRPCGLLPNPCEGKSSGFYPDEKSNCQHYIECSRGVMVSNGTCPSGSVFSAISGRCDRPENAPEPCGLAPSCEDKDDGKYSALTRGCSFYFECKQRKFAGLKQCSIEDGGFFFNERTGQCDFPQNICAPCGYRWWGCPRTFYR